MKNDILKISGVSFSECSCLWSVPAASDNFPGIFEYFKGRMQKESPRGCIEDHVGYRPKPNIENRKNDENDDFSDFDFEPICEAGEPRGSSKSIPGIKK